MIKTAREYLGYGVCAADLAGAEAAYPMAQFMELFQNTRKLEMPFTLHAGECGSVQNIVDSVKAGAGRIGHGIAMRGHYNIQKELADRGIGIEMCPISNLQTKAVNSPSEYRHNALHQMMYAGAIFILVAALFLWKMRVRLTGWSAGKDNAD